MRYAAAYILAVMGGNATPDVASIAKILGSVGISCDPDLAQKVIDAMKGRNIEEVIAEGMTKLDQCSLSNAAVVSNPTTTSDVVAIPTPPAPQQPPRPETPPSPDGMGFDLFG